MDYKKIIVYVAAAIILCNISFFAGTIITKHQLVEQHRQQLELSRQRASFLTDTIEDIRTEVDAIGESFSRQRNSVSELRALIGEVKERYTKMEELISSVRWNDDYLWNINSSTNNVNED